MNDSENPRKVGLRHSDIMEALEDAEPEELRAILGADYVEDDEAPALMQALRERLSATRPALAAILADNVETFPTSRSRPSVAADMREFERAHEQAEAYFTRIADAPIETGRPFAREIKNRIRAAFPADAGTFDDVDQQTRSIERVSFLRQVADGALFLALGAVAFIAQGAAEAGDMTVYGATIAILAAGACLFSAQTVGGWAVSARNRHTIDALQTRMYGAYDRILNDMKRINRASLEWPENAVKWPAIAVWYSKRGEYIDRYFTAVFWRRYSRVRNVNAAATMLKFALLGVSLVAGFTKSLGLALLLRAGPLAIPIGAAYLIAFAMAMASNAGGEAFSGLMSWAHSRVTYRPPNEVWLEAALESGARAVSERDVIYTNLRGHQQAACSLASSARRY